VKKYIWQQNFWLWLTFPVIFYYSMLENIACSCLTVLLRVRFANTITDKDSFPSYLYISLFSLFRVVFPCWVSEEDKSNNKKNSSSSTREAIYLTTYIHIHTEQNRFLLQTKETFLRRYSVSANSPSNFISHCIYTNRDVNTTTILK